MAENPEISQIGEDIQINLAAILVKQREAEWNPIRELVRQINQQTAAGIDESKDFHYRLENYFREKPYGVLVFTGIQECADNGLKLDNTLDSYLRYLGQKYGRMMAFGELLAITQTDRLSSSFFNIFWRMTRQSSA